MTFQEKLENMGACHSATQECKGLTLAQAWRTSVNGNHMAYWLFAQYGVPLKDLLRLRPKGTFVNVFTGHEGWTDVTRAQFANTLRRHYTSTGRHRVVTR